MKIHLLRNPSGGTTTTRRAAAEAVGRLRGAGHEIIELTEGSPAESSERLGEAIADGQVTHVLTAGGDGLVHLAIQHLARTDIPLSIAPTGTGNDFASALGIAGTRVDVDAEPRAVDLLRITDGSDVTWVASIAICGFPAAINQRANASQLQLGRQIYTWAALCELPTFDRTTIELLVDGEPHALDSAMLAIGNTQLFGGGMLACPDARPDDGLADLTSIEGVGRFGIFRHLLQRAGGSADRPEVLRLRGRQILIENQGVALWGDGEPVAQSPVTIDVIAGALRVRGAKFR